MIGVGVAVVAYYLYTKMKTPTISVASVTGANPTGAAALPGSSAALNAAGASIGQGLVSLFNSV